MEGQGEEEERGENFHFISELNLEKVKERK